ncbi:hypothetical protein KDH_03070 [Dictyobacter sp. S3.2.2.5]|uniref:Zinc finger CGNR domain-containing protein n=1 Tax=Dictyobacter halimunensis TaxID=3026934 RepID=A0ABQ6FLM9_9CHLR|nr:hypothetical protein KDH_03070 [Dictyobacter sp. S3.2.2.5]
MDDLDESISQENGRPKMPHRLGGLLCLDFVNTVDPRHSQQRIEYLTSYTNLVVWGSSVDIVNANEEQWLLQEAEQHPAIAAITLQRAHMLREALYRMFSAYIEKRAVGQQDLEVLNVTLAEGMARARIRPESEGFSWTWDDNRYNLDRMLWPVARSAAELLIAPELVNIKECPGDDGCGWLFIDASRNHRRRWCGMKECGNRAKARRHHERQAEQRT